MALRLVQAELATAPAFRERFRREVRAAAAAPPWFTAPVLDADPNADPPWVATEARWASRGSRRWPSGWPTGSPLHGAGLVQRDLKPSNVLLAEDGPRLIDGGISPSPGSAAPTVAGSPEQAARIGSRTSPRSPVASGRPRGRAWPRTPRRGRRRRRSRGCCGPAMRSARPPHRWSTRRSRPATEPGSTAAAGPLRRRRGQDRADRSLPAAGSRVVAIVVAVLVVAAGIATAVLLPRGTGAGATAAGPTPGANPFSVAPRASAPAPATPDPSDPAAGAVLLDAETDGRFGTGSATVSPT